MLLSFEHWFSISDIYYLILTNLFYCLLLMRANVFFCDRLLKFLLPRLVSTVMPSVTLLGLIFSLPRSLKILCPLLTTVMYAPVHVFHVYCFFSSVNSLSDDTYWNFFCSQILFVFFFLLAIFVDRLLRCLMSAVGGYWRPWKCQAWAARGLLFLVKHFYLVLYQFNLKWFCIYVCRLFNILWST